MKIKKKEQSIGVVGKIVNEQSSSTNDTYSCNYINGIIGSEIQSYTKDNIQVVKFDDGTMIMYFQTTVTISDTSPRQYGGLTYYSGYNEITLPEEFYYASFALLTTVLQANMNYYNKSYGAIDNTKSIRVSFTSTDANESRPISVVCIGRWKA